MGSEPHSRRLLLPCLDWGMGRAGQDAGWVSAWNVSGPFNACPRPRTPECRLLQWPGRRQERRTKRGVEGMERRVRCGGFQLPSYFGQDP